MVVATILGAAVSWAEDPVFSGPQTGEKTTGFKVIPFGGDTDGKERDPINENAGAPTALVFVHALERSLVPLLRVIDNYGSQRKDRLKTEIIFLGGDRVGGEQRARAASGSLRLQSRVGFSVDGAEGPGNYGLNSQCMMTIVVARDNKATANFALVQPGIAHAPKVVEALAAACGDEKPPSVEELSALPAGRGGEGAARMAPREFVDFSKLDISSEAGLQDAVRALMAEVTRLRTEVEELRKSAQPRARVRSIPQQ